MYLGIDLGTSGVKVVLLDDRGRVMRTESAPLNVSRPRPLWSEQEASWWWAATLSALTSLKSYMPLKELRAVGVTGQMHGATLLDDRGTPIRPAILWNDGRSAAECGELEARVPEAGRITGNRIMPGFTAPKLLWVAKNEPEVFAATKMVLLPKDYLRFRLTGDYATDVSDAAGTMWLDVGTRSWSSDLLEATGLTVEQMPKVYEGPDVTGRLSEEMAQMLGCDRVPVVAGAGDNAGGALGVGLTTPGQAMLSLGTSGTYFVVTGNFAQNSGEAVHSFCHALPETWHVMSVILSAASCLTWLQSATGAPNVETLLEEAAAVQATTNLPYFLPYLAGERTPHNDPFATGMFFGLTHATGRGHLVQSVLEGVSFALSDGADALHSATDKPEAITLIGGGARSEAWSQLLANVLNLPLNFREGGDVGPALGAARLARRSDRPELPVTEVFPVPELVRSHEPIEKEVVRLHERRETFRKLYQRVKDLSN